MLLSIQDTGVSAFYFSQLIRRYNAGPRSPHNTWLPYAEFAVRTLCNAEQHGGCITLARFSRLVAWFGPHEPLEFLIRATWIFSRRY